MKNIHVLPSDKPSELYINIQGDLSKSNSLLLRPKSRNIYISSNEEIKEGDWFYSDDTNIISRYLYILPVKEVKKIIMTSDPNLIKDGVQSIPDEFLEWFVENPTCEEVEVIKDEIKVKSNGIQELMKDEYYRQFPEELPNCVFIDKYKIIIPKEEYYFPDIKIGSILSSEDIVKDITELENQSFEGWTTDSIKGYLLACKNIKEKLI